MPSFELYKKMLGGITDGQARKRDSDFIMNATWWEDINSRVGYLYDMYHDKDPYGLKDLDPQNDEEKIPIDIKYIQHSSQTYEKDKITYHLQLRPGQTCNIPYYHKYEETYASEFPQGLYCDIQNEAGHWDRWLIVDKANGEAPQFPTYEILKCDYTFQYVIEHKKYAVAGILRSQNS